MGAGHGHRLHYHGHSAVHRLPAQCKLVALATFMICVVATPRGAYTAYAVHAVLLGGVLAVSRVPPAYIGRRMVIEAPFVVFAVLLPFVASGPTTDVFGLTVSRAGLEGAGSLLAKGTLGVVAALLLAATTEPRDLLLGLQRLRVPQQLVQILSLMVRYLDVVTDELRRMRIARSSRCFEARGAQGWGILARSLGALFIRSYERGERVHLAMLARGYAGQLPGGSSAPAATGQWAAAASLPVLAAVAAAAAWWLAG